MELGELADDLLAVIPAMDRDAAAQDHGDYIPALGTVGEDGFRRAAVRQLTTRWPEKYSELHQESCYRGIPRGRCDLALGPPEAPVWAIELKKVALVGDNGKNNDFAPSKAVSPYPIHRSSVLDAQRLHRNRIATRGAVLMLGFDIDAQVVEECRKTCEERGHGPERAKALADVVKRNGGDYVVEPLFGLFEMISQPLDYELGQRIERCFSGLTIHPIFRKGRFAIWEILNRQSKVGPHDVPTIRLK
jgi:hypothetical protein